MKKASAIIFILLALCLSEACLSFFQNKLLISAQNSLKSGNCELAKSQVDEALKANPNDAELQALKTKIDTCLENQKFQKLFNNIFYSMNRYDLHSKLKGLKEAQSMRANDKTVSAAIVSIEDDILKINRKISNIRNSLNNSQLWKAFEEYKDLSPYSDYIPEVRTLYSSINTFIPAVAELFRTEYHMNSITECTPHLNLLKELFPNDLIISSLEEEFEGFALAKYDKAIKASTKGLNKDWLGIGYLMYLEAYREFPFAGIASKLSEAKQHLIKSRPAMFLFFSERISKETKEALFSSISFRYSPCYQASPNHKMEKEDILLNIKCIDDSIEEAGRDNRNLPYSKFQNGTEQKANPKYDVVYQSYQQTKHYYDQIYLNYLANPSIISLFVLNEALKKLKVAEQNLLMVPRFVEVPRYDNYQYEKYSISVKSTMIYEYQLVDMQIKEEIGRRVIEREHLGEGTIIQQAHPNDANGIKNIDYPIQASIDLHESTKRELCASIAESIIQDLKAALKNKATKLNASGNTALAINSLGQYAALNPDEDVLVDNAEIKKKIDLALDGGKQFALQKDFSASGRKAPESILARKYDQSGLSQKQLPRLLVKEDVELLVSRSAKAVVSIKTLMGEGSGFLIAADGQILTNYHVIEGFRDIIVVKQDGSKYFASIIKNDKSLDLALIKIEATNNTYLKLSNSSNANVGSSVIIIGSPFGLEQSVTKGIISAKRPYLGKTLIQTDAAVNPGNSGGPLITMDGYVIGIVSQAIRKNIGEGLGFAISAEDIKAFLLN